MEWFHPKRRGPEWKQGWAGQTLGSISTPPIPLLTIFAIVLVLLWLSQYTGYKSQLRHTAINFQLYLFLFPLLLMLVLAVYSTNWMLNLRSQRLQHYSVQHSGGGGGSSYSPPWGIAIFVVLLLVLLSYQSSFHSRWFGPLSRSD